MLRSGMRSLVALVLLAACTQPEGSPGKAVRFAPSSGTIVASDDGSALYNVNVDEGTITRLDLASGKTKTLDVAGEPVRLAGFGQKLLVTLRDRRTLAVVEDRGGVLSVVEEVDTAAEPVGVVVSSDESRVYVANSLQNEVWEYDADLELLRTFSVGDHPYWLALGVGDTALYVASEYGGTLTWLNLTEDDPEGQTYTFQEFGGVGDEHDELMARRLTGDIAVSPDGEKLAVAALWVDNKTTAGENASDPYHAIERYEQIGLAVSPNNPVIYVIDLDADGTPLTDGARGLLQVGWAEPVAGTPEIVRSQLTSVEWSPDGAYLLSTMEGSSLVVVNDANPDRQTATMDDRGYYRAPMAFVRVPHGPRGLAFVDGDVWSHGFLDRAAASFSLAEAGTLVASTEAGTSDVVAMAAGEPITLTESGLSPEATAGQRLFFTTIDRRMAAPGVGVTCSTCHHDGRNDGLTGPFEFGPRQVLSLAGHKAATPPFTWTLEVPTVGDEAQKSIDRLGGLDTTDEDRANIEAFVDTLRVVDVPNKGVMSDAAVRGKEIFERDDVGCSGCHYGEYFTDTVSHEMFGLKNADTPTLVGIAATPPYFHDGRSATLREAMEEVRSGEMGDTSMLSDAEIDDLVAYLETL